MKLWFKGILLSVTFVFTAATAYPCTCEIWKPQKKLRKARAVFVGELVAKATNDKDNFATVSLKFQVDRYWKGIKEPFITVVSAPDICCVCGLPVHVGAKYLIYAFDTANGQIETGTCMSATLDAERSQDELKILGKAKLFKR